MMGYYENSLYLKDLGVISGKDITTESAITKSMFLLAENLNRDDFERAFHQSLCGEISE
jgi:L-asparaginase